jgi:3-phosphoshikimate 1-carboxyvinyltransferase
MSLCWHITPGGAIGGEAPVPGDKSISHRALMLLGVSEAGGRISGLLESTDCLATLDAMRALGVDIQRQRPGEYTTPGLPDGGLISPARPLDLGNSGTGLRLLTGLLAGRGTRVELRGDESLSRRPMARIVEPLRRMGARIRDTDGHAPLWLEPASDLRGIEYPLPMASAQVKSALLLAGLSALGETRLRVPATTRDHTERMLSALGCPVERSHGWIRLLPAPLRGGDIQVPGDLSAAAFFLALGALHRGSRIRLRGVGVNPTRDGILSLLARMGLAIHRDLRDFPGGEPVADLDVQGGTLRAIRVAPEEVALAIDEIPVLLAAAAGAEGTTEIHGAAELRVKESDRIAAMAEGLKRLGLQVRTWADGIAVTGGPVSGGEVDSFGDHRIAMALAMLATVAAGPVTVRGCDNVMTSFPGFETAAATVGVRIRTGESEA